MTTRASREAQWETPETLGASVNSFSLDMTPSFPADGSMLYFASGRPGSAGGDSDFWQAPIIPTVDFNGDEIVNIKNMLANQLWAFKPEDRYVFQILISLIEQMDTFYDPEKGIINRKNYEIFLTRALNELRSLNRGQIGRLSNPADLEAWLASFFRLERNSTGHWTGRAEAKPEGVILELLGSRKRMLYKRLMQQVAVVMRRDMNTFFLAGIEESKRKDRPLISDRVLPDGTLLRSLLSKWQRMAEIRPHAEMLIFGPNEAGLTGTPRFVRPNRILNLTQVDQLALLSRLEEGTAARGLSSSTVIDILDVGNTWKVEEVETRPGVKVTKVTFPFQEDVWELYWLLNGKEKVPPFPKGGWPRKTEEEMREFFGTIYGEAELLALITDANYAQQRAALVKFLRANPDSVKKVLDRVHKISEIVKDASRPDGLTIHRAVPRTYSKATTLEKGMIRAILNAAAQPGGDLDQELKRLEVMEIILADKDHLARAIENAPIYFRTVLGPLVVLPEISMESIPRNPVAMTMITTYLMMGINVDDLPDEKDALHKAVVASLEKWEKDVAKLQDQFRRFPGDRDVMLAAAFEEGAARAGLILKGVFSYDTKQYENAEDQALFEQFQAELSRKNLGIYLAYLNILLDALPEPATVGPRVAVAGLFDGDFKPEPSLVSEHKSADALVDRLLHKTQTDLKLPKGVLNSDEYGSMNIPFTTQNKDNAILYYPYGHLDIAQPIRGGVSVHNPEKKGDKQYERVGFDARQLFATARGVRPLISEDKFRDMRILLNIGNRGGGYNDKPVGIAWQHRSPLDQQFKEVLGFRGQDGYLKIGDEKIYLGMEDEKYGPMQTFAIYGARVDGNDFQMTVILDGDRFVGKVHVKAKIDDTTGEVTVDVRSQYTAKGDVAIHRQAARELAQPNRHLTFVGIATSQAVHRQANFFTVKGPEEVILNEPAASQPAYERGIGGLNGTYAYTLVGAGESRNITVELIPVKDQQYDTHVLIDSAEKTGGRLPSYVTTGIPRGAVKPGAIILSHVRVRVSDNVPGLVARPATWPVAVAAAKPAGEPDISGEARKIKGDSARADYLYTRNFNKEVLVVVDAYFEALLADKTLTKLTSFIDVDPEKTAKNMKNLDRLDPEGYGRLRAFFGATQDIEAPTHEAALEEHIKRTKAITAILAVEAKRRSMIASVILNDILISGKDSAVFALLDGPDLADFKESLERDKFEFINQLMLDEAGIKKVVQDAISAGRDLTVEDLFRKDAAGLKAQETFKKLLSAFEAAVDDSPLLQGNLAGISTATVKDWNAWFENAFRVMTLLRKAFAMNTEEGLSADELELLAALDGKTGFEQEFQLAALRAVIDDAVRFGFSPTDMPDFLASLVAEEAPDSANAEVLVVDLNDQETLDRLTLAQIREVLTARGMEDRVVLSVPQQMGLDTIFASSLGQLTAEFPTRLVVAYGQNLDAVVAAELKRLDLAATAMKQIQIDAASLRPEVARSLLKLAAERLPSDPFLIVSGDDLVTVGGVKAQGVALPIAELVAAWQAYKEAAQLIEQAA